MREAFINTAKETVYLVMDYIEGNSLKEYID